MDYVKAFIIGGIICGLAQILLDKTRMMPGRVMVTLVISGSILGALGIKEGIGSDGFLGVFKGGFTAGATGICGALVFGYLGAQIFKPKMKG